MDVKIQKKISMFLQHFSINNSRRQKVVGRVAPSICVIHLRVSFYLNVFESRGGGGSVFTLTIITNYKAYLVVSNARFTAHSPTHTGTQPTFLSTWYRTRSNLSCQHLLCTHQLPATALRARGGHRKVAFLPAV